MRHELQERAERGRDKGCVCVSVGVGVEETKQTQTNKKRDGPQDRDGYYQKSITVPHKLADTQL